MPKTIKEVYTDYSGYTTVEYSDGSTRTYTVDDVPTVQSNSITGGKELQVDGLTRYLSAGTAGVLQTICIGDSMTAQINGNNATITAAVRSGGVVTCTSTAHILGNQTVSDIVNMVPADFNANGVTITRIDANTFSYPSAGADGSASALGGLKPMIAINRNSQADIGYLVWLNGKSGGAINLIRNAGANGQTAADMRERFTRDVLAYQPQQILLLTGYNDFVNAGRTAQAVYDDVVAMCGAASGRMVTVISAIPWTTGGTNAQRAQAVIYNRMIRNFCNSTTNVRFADAARYVVDATSATRFSPLAGMLGSDGIHPAPRCAERMAQAIYDTNKDRWPTPSRLVSSNADNYGFDAGNKNLVDAAPWVATGGALAGTSPATGTVASGWVVTNNGTGTTVASVPARADGIGFDQQVVFTSSASSDAAVVGIAGTGWASGRFVAGQKLLCMFELGLSGLAGANIRSIETRFGFNTTPAVSSHVTTATQPNASTYMNIDQVLTMVSQEITVPAGATTITFQVTATAAGAGTALTMKVGRLSVEIVS